MLGIEFQPAGWNGVKLLAFSVTKGCLRSWKVSSIGRRCYMVLSVGLQKGDMSSNWV
jgi:hypothetical protein